MIAINDAIDEAIFVEYTWLLVAVLTQDGSSKIALLRFEEDGIKLRKLFSSLSSPCDGIVLRGPHVLYTDSNGVTLEGDSGEIALDAFADGKAASAEGEVFLCRVEADTEAVVARRFERVGLTGLLKLYTVHSSGLCHEIKTFEIASIGSVKRLSLCLHQSALIIAEGDGSLRSFDTNSGDILWKSPSKKELENPLYLTCSDETLVMTSSVSEAVWSMPICMAFYQKGLTNRASILFPESCNMAAKDETHGHFFAPWRGSILQVSNSNGAYCFEKDFSKLQTQNSLVPVPESETRFSSAVSRKLEKRLGAGVERVTDAAQRQEEKIEILNHLRSLLAEVAGQRSRASFPKKFHEGLESAIILNKARESHPRDNMDKTASVDDQGDPSARVFVGCNPTPFNSARFLDFVESQTGVDRSSRFVLIQVCVAVSKQATSDDEMPSSAFSLQLSIQFDRCMAAIWDVEKKNNVHQGDVVWLKACAPISAIVANSVSSMESIRVIVRVDTDDGRSQYLGTFSLSAVLSSVVPSEKSKALGVDNGLLNFERTIHAVAQGPSAQNLQNLLQDEGSRLFDVKVLQKLAHVRFRASSNIELALAIAKIRASVDDRVSLRSSSELSIDSLQILDSSLRCIEKEMQSLRDMARQRGAIGYDVNQISDLLRLQLEVDESFGRCGEIFAGL